MFGPFAKSLCSIEYERIVSLCIHVTSVSDTDSITEHSEPRPFDTSCQSGGLIEENYVYCSWLIRWSVQNCLFIEYDIERHQLM